ncbi:MAG: acetylglutamate kinase [Cyclobacteriaceae bacterium]
MKEELTIVKVGGKVLENDSNKAIFLDSFSKISGKKILVHGGGVLADRLLEKQGIAPQMKNGRRITDEQTLETVIMTYGGLVNKQLVANLTAFGIQAVGITGADGLTVQSVKRPAKPVDYGYAGDVVAINTGLTNLLLQGDFLPVIAPLSITAEGQLLNTNADTMACRIAMACSEKYKVNLVYSFELIGVMKDMKDPATLIQSLTTIRYKEMTGKGLIYEGMIPKLDNAFLATEHTAKTLITHFSNLHEALTGNNDQYTKILSS